jgi:hypothetical protein
MGEGQFPQGGEVVLEPDENSQRIKKRREEFFPFWMLLPHSVGIIIKRTGFIKKIRGRAI